MTDLIEKNSADISLINGEFQDYIRSRGIVDGIPFQDFATTEFIRNYEFPINSWPFFVSPDFVSDMQEMNKAIPRLTYKALQNIFANDPMQMSSVLNLDLVLCSFFFNGIDFSDVCFRTDAILGKDGLKIVEVNVGTSIGGWQIQWMDEAFRESDAYQDFFERHDVVSRNTPVAFFKFLIRSAEKVSQSGKLNILMKVRPGFDVSDYGSFLQQYILKAMSETGRECEIGFFRSFSELEVSQAGTFYKGNRVHLLTFGDLSRDKVGPPVELLRCVIVGKLSCPDFPTYILLTDKRNMALLHYAAQNNLLSESECLQVERYVPKTFIMGGALFSDSIWDDLLENKDNYVVKRCDGMQGVDVHVGRFVSKADWQSILSNLDKPELWIAQEYCESTKFYGHSGASRDIFNFVWGIFQFGGYFGGSWIRMMPENGEYDGVINSARGAEESIVFEAGC